MEIGILLVTHHPLGSNLLTVATRILGTTNAQVEVCDVIFDTDPEQVLTQIAQKLDRLNNLSSVLVMTDMLGATPNNLACRLAAIHPDIALRVIAGLNLPMLIRALQYDNSNLTLSELETKALEGGRVGVCECTSTSDQPQHPTVISG